MTERFLLLSISGLLGAMALAESLPDAPAPPEVATEISAPAEIETPAELTAALREQDAASKVLEQKDAEERTALRDWYAAALDTMRLDAISAGDLDHVVAVDLERARMESDLSPEEKAKLFYTLRELRGRYDRQRAEQMRHMTAEARAGLQRLAGALDRLAGIFLQNGNVAAARVVERARLSMAGAPPRTAVASIPVSYPSTGSVPPAPSSSGSSAPVKAAPAPTVAHTSAPSSKQGADAPPKSKPAVSSGKVAGNKTGPSATSVSAPVTQVAKQTVRPVLPQSSGKSAPSAPRSVAVVRPASPGASAPSRPSGGDGRAIGIVVR